jgi:hypothetical protein
MRKAVLTLVSALLLLAGCAGIEFSQLSPEARDFHPRTIAAIPATVGEYEAARDTVDAIVYRKLVRSEWYENVLDAGSIRAKTTESKEFSDDLGSYVQKLNTLGLSDAALSVKLRETLMSDAFFLTYVTSWGYGRQEGEKIARVGLGVKLVDAAKGTVIWKANHEIVEDYVVMKPSLEKITEEVMDALMKEMPH